LQLVRIPRPKGARARAAAAGVLPAAPRRARRRAARKPLAVPRTLTYPGKTAPRAPKLGTEEKYALGALGLSGRRAIRRGVGRAVRAVGALRGKTVRGTAVRAAVRAGAGRAGARLALGYLGGAAAVAGVAAYYITRAIINRRARTREERAENAFQIAKAYRLMRADLAKRQGFPLTTEQLQLAAQTFKTELAKLGLTTTDLGRL
jgi:hypothetical protein